MILRIYSTTFRRQVCRFSLVYARRFLINELPLVAANKPRISDVPSECDEDECGDCDTSFWVDGHSNDDVGDTSQDSDYDFSSERFFQEEESSRPSHTFYPDPLSDVLQSLRVEEDMEHAAKLATSCTCSLQVFSWLLTEPLI